MGDKSLHIMDNFSVIYNNLNSDMPLNNISCPKSSSTERLEKSNLPGYYLNTFLNKDVLYWLLNKVNKGPKKLKNSAIITEDELRCFISIIYLSGYLKVPCRRLLWEQAPDCRNQLVSSAIQSSRFEYIFMKLFSSDERDKNEVHLKFLEFNALVNHILLKHCPYDNEFNIAQMDVGNNKGLKVWCGTNKSGYCNFISMFPKDNNAYNIIMQYANMLKQRGPSKFTLFFDNTSIQQQMFCDLKQIDIDAVCSGDNVDSFYGINQLRSNISLYKSRVSGKIFSHYFAFYLDVILHNAYLLYKSKSIGNAKQLDLLEFRRNIVIYYLEKHGKPISRKASNTTTCNKKILTQESRFDRIRHYIVPQTKPTICENCGNRTATKCKKCNIGVHIKCFEDFHTK